MRRTKAEPIKDWTKAAAYREERSPREWAWEFLRRNADYQALWRHWADAFEQFVADGTLPDAAQDREPEWLKAWRVHVARRRPWQVGSTLRFVPVPPAIVDPWGVHFLVNYRIDDPPKQLLSFHAAANPRFGLLDPGGSGIVFNKAPRDRIEPHEVAVVVDMRREIARQLKEAKTWLRDQQKARLVVVAMWRASSRQVRSKRSSEDEVMARAFLAAPDWYGEKVRRYRAPDADTLVLYLRALDAYAAGRSPLQIARLRPETPINDSLLKQAKRWRRPAAYLSLLIQRMGK